MLKQDRVSIEEFEQTISNAENTYNNILSKNIIKMLFVLIVFCLYMYLPKTLWLIPSKFTNEKLNPYQEPVMIKINDNINAVDLKKGDDYSKLIKYKSFKNRKMYYLMPLAEYSITAKVFEKNTFFYLQDDFDNVSLVDYGFVWGDMAKKEYFNKLYGHSNQDITGRRLIFYFKKKYKVSLKNKFDYMRLHTSHTHTIPANKNIKRVLDSLQKEQTVKLEGYLVDVYNNNYRRFAITSLSLSDEGHENGRGGGACEIMYVTKVQVGGKVFE